ncbi:hypothetical protein GCK32_006473 [Trichostrongylus colubriformis]|uniref:Uncharacterized protein n=1 Tax=Trichostrongylus colubriformis TaxID=6319 RepID=A0AAN8G736_TRICO
MGVAPLAPNSLLLKSAMSQRRDRLWLKRYSVWPPLRMPEEGIFTENGYLFHHETPQILDERHRERLLEYGIELAFGDRFTPEEDDRIRKNWRAVARKYNFIHDDARFYAGHLESLESVKEQRVQNAILIKIGMWPQLCRKLESRSAYQVQNRMLRIFDPYYVGAPSPLPREIVLHIHELAFRGESRGEIARLLALPRRQVDHVLYNNKRRLERQGWTAEDVARDLSMLERNCLPRDRYRKLFETVLSKSSLCESKVAEYLRSSSSNLMASLVDFNWTVLIPAFRPLQAEEIKHEWENIIKQLSESYLANLESFDDPKAWVDAMDKVMPQVRFSLRDLLYYMKSLRKCIDEKATLVRSRFIDKEKLVGKLSAEGIVDVEHFNLNTCPIYRRIVKVICFWNSEVFRQLRFPLTAREMLRILEECYRRSKAPTNETASRTSLPKISTHLLVECVIDRMRHIDPSWQPPVIFQQWVRSWDHIRLFSKYSNNEEIRNSVVDRHRSRETLFENPKHCLYGSVPSAREVYTPWEDNWMGQPVSLQHVTSSVQATRDKDHNGRRSKRRRSCNSLSDASMEDMLQSSNPQDPGGSSGRGYAWKSPPCTQQSDRRESFESDRNRSSSCDIFADAAEETILAGNVVALEEQACSRDVSLSEPTSASLHVSRVPTTIVSEISVRSPEISPKRREVHWEDDEESFDALKIFTPVHSAKPEAQRRKDDHDIGPQEGWLQFLA